MGFRLLFEICAIVMERNTKGREDRSKLMAKKKKVMGKGKQPSLATIADNFSREVDDYITQQRADALSAAKNNHPTDCLRKLNKLLRVFKALQNPDSIPALIREDNRSNKLTGLFRKIKEKVSKPSDTKRVLGRIASVDESDTSIIANYAQSKAAKIQDIGKIFLDYSHQQDKQKFELYMATNPTKELYVHKTELMDGRACYDALIKRLDRLEKIGYPKKGEHYFALYNMINDNVLSRRDTTNAPLKTSILLSALASSDGYNALENFIDTTYRDSAKGWRNIRNTFYTVSVEDLQKIPGETLVKLASKGILLENIPYITQADTNNSEDIKLAQNMFPPNQSQLYIRILVAAAENNPSDDAAQKSLHAFINKVLLLSEKSSTEQAGYYIKTLKHGFKKSSHPDKYLSLFYRAMSHYPEKTQVAQTEESKFQKSLHEVADAWSKELAEAKQTTAVQEQRQDPSSSFTKLTEKEINELKNDTNPDDTNDDIYRL
jgi:hypothetical protein